MHSVEVVEAGRVCMYGVEAGRICMHCVEAGRTSRVMGAGRWYEYGCGGVSHPVPLYWHGDF